MVVMVYDLNARQTVDVLVILVLYGLWGGPRRGGTNFYGITTTSSCLRLRGIGTDPLRKERCSIGQKAI